MTPRRASHAKLFWSAAVVLPLGVVLLFAVLWWGGRAEEFRHATDLKYLGIALTMCANDDYYPPLSSEPGRLMFEMDAVYPEYVNHPETLLSHADPVRRAIRDSEISPEFCFENSSYFYLGYKVWDDETVEAFAGAYRERVKQGLPFDADLPVDLPMGRLTRLDGALRRQGMVTLAESEAPENEHLRHSDSEIPLLVERPNPYPGPFGLWFFTPIPLSRPTMGGMVLYKDGHSEFIPYPGKWPMTERTIATLASLAEMASGKGGETAGKDPVDGP